MKSRGYCSWCQFQLFLFDVCIANCSKFLKMFGGLILYMIGSELVNFSLIKAKLYRHGALISLRGEIIEKKIETMSYVASWNLLQLYFCLTNKYLCFQLFQKHKVEMQGKGKKVWKSFNAFAMSDSKSSDNGRHLHTISWTKDEVTNFIIKKIKSINLKT